jgi:zinc transport system permease protein
MADIVVEMFSYTFLVRAFAVGALVSLCAALLGVSLVVKRYSMIGDGLSHVGFGTLALATAMNAAPLAVSAPVVIAAAFLLLRLSENSKIKGDAAIALISTGSLAVGVVIISMTSGMNTDVCNYLFGSILAMSRSDVYVSIGLSVTVLALFALFYNKLFAITFDESFAKAAGVKTGVYNMLVAFLTAITIVVGMRIMGAMLISSLIVFPALTSMRVFKKFRSVTICSACVSIVCFFIGVIISYIYATPTGASVVMINIFAFLLFWALNLIKSSRFIKGTSVSLALCIFLVAGCADSPVIEINEKMFIAQTNDVYRNSEDYMGKTIKLEGLFKREQSAVNNAFYCFVLRYGPGCCGTDGNAGIEVAGKKGAVSGKPYPNTDEWVEAVGELKTYEENGLPYLYIALSSLTVLEKRGAEFVTQ